jgi:hypothetical protein
MSIDKSTYILTEGSHGGVDDEYYIDEIIGIDDFTYSDWHHIDPRFENKLQDLDVDIQNVLVIL